MPDSPGYFKGQEKATIFTTMNCLNDSDGTSSSEESFVEARRVKQLLAGGIPKRDFFPKDIEVKKPRRSVINRAFQTKTNIPSSTPLTKNTVQQFSICISPISANRKNNTRLKSNAINSENVINTDAEEFVNPNDILEEIEEKRKNNRKRSRPKSFKSDNISSKYNCSGVEKLNYSSDEEQVVENNKNSRKDFVEKKSFKADKQKKTSEKDSLVTRKNGSILVKVTTNEDKQKIKKKSKKDIKATTEQQSSCSSSEGENFNITGSKNRSRVIRDSSNEHEEVENVKGSVKVQNNNISVKSNTLRNEHFNVETEKIGRNVDKKTIQIENKNLAPHSQSKRNDLSVKSTPKVSKTRNETNATLTEIESTKSKKSHISEKITPSNNIQNSLPSKENSQRKISYRIVESQNQTCDRTMTRSVKLTNKSEQNDQVKLQQPQTIDRSTSPLPINFQENVSDKLTLNSCNKSIILPPQFDIVAVEKNVNKTSSTSRQILENITLSPLQKTRHSQRLENIILPLSEKAKAKQLRKLARQSFAVNKSIQTSQGDSNVASKFDSKVLYLTLPDKSTLFNSSHGDASSILRDILYNTPTREPWRFNGENQCEKVYPNFLLETANEVKLNRQSNSIHQVYNRSCKNVSVNTSVCLERALTPDDIDELVTVSRGDENHNRVDVNEISHRDEHDCITPMQIPSTSKQCSPHLSKTNLSKQCSPHSSKVNRSVLNKETTIDKNTTEKRQSVNVLEKSSSSQQNLIVVLDDNVEVEQNSPKAPKNASRIDKSCDHRDIPREEVNDPPHNKMIEVDSQKKLKNEKLCGIANSKKLAGSINMSQDTTLGTRKSSRIRRKPVDKYQVGVFHLKLKRNVKFGITLIESDDLQTTKTSKINETANQKNSTLKKITPSTDKRKSKKHKNNIKSNTKISTSNKSKKSTAVDDILTLPTLSETNEMCLNNSVICDTNVDIVNNICENMPEDSQRQQNFRPANDIEVEQGSCRFFESNKDSGRSTMVEDTWSKSVHSTGKVNKKYTKGRKKNCVLKNKIFKNEKCMELYNEIVNLKYTGKFSCENLNRGFFYKNYTNFDGRTLAQVNIPPLTVTARQNYKHYNLCVVVLQGEGLVFFQDERFTVEKGHWFVVPAGNTYSIQNTSKEINLELWFKKTNSSISMISQDESE